MGVPNSSDEIVKIFETLIKNNKVEQKGFILLPSMGGFNLYEIAVDRLEMYLKLESMQNNVINKTKQNKNEV